MGSNHDGITTILLNALSARQGGGPTYVINLLAGLPKELPVKVFILAPDSLPIPTDRQNLHEIPVTWPVQNPFIRAIWERLCLPRLLKRIGADVLFCPGGIIGCQVPRGCKSVTVFQNMIPFSPVQRQRYPFGYMRLRNWLLERIFLRSMLYSDLIIFGSNYAKSVIEQRARGALKKTVTIPNGIAVSFRDVTATDRSLAWLPPEGYLLYASTLDEYKAQLEVVQAFGILKTKRYTKEKLLLVGPEYPGYAARVREKIKELRLENDVLITGPIPYSDMPTIYHNAILNIFASECENCPNILMEALAAGRPVFSSNYPPMPEIAGNAALYFDPRSPDDLAEKLATILDDPERMRDFGEKATERARLYEWASTAQETWSAIRQLATG